MNPGICVKAVNIRVLSKIAEVIEFSVLENLIGVPKDRKDILLKYMEKKPERFLFAFK